MKCKLITEDNKCKGFILETTMVEYLAINSMVGRCKDDKVFPEADRKIMEQIGETMKDFEVVETKRK